MTVYALAQLSMQNRDAYNRYQAKFMDVFKQFRGQLLAADEHALVLEGTWERDKIVLMSFPDADAFREFHESPAYQEIAVDRRLGASAVVLLVHGVAPRF